MQSYDDFFFSMFTETDLRTSSLHVHFMHFCNTYSGVQNHGYPAMNAHGGKRATSKFLCILDTDRSQR